MKEEAFLRATTKKWKEDSKQGQEFSVAKHKLRKGPVKKSPLQLNKN